MLNIYLARHGQDRDNEKGILNGRRDRPLTTKGIEQATELARKIKYSGIKFDKIYSSPLKRTAQTASIVAKIIDGPSPELTDLLIERDFGLMTGKLISDIEKLCAPNVLKTNGMVYFLSPDGAETFPQLIKRGKKLLNFLNKKHKIGNILLVSHGDFGKMLYCAYYNRGWKEVLKMFHFGNSELILMSPDSNPNNAHIFHIEQFNS